MLRDGRTGRYAEDYEPYDGLLAALEALQYTLTLCATEWHKTTQYLARANPELYARAEDAIRELEKHFH